MLLNSLATRLILLLLSTLSMTPADSFQTVVPSREKNALMSKVSNNMIVRGCRLPIALASKNRVQSLLVTTLTSADMDAPAEYEKGNVSIVYCTGCRWMLRSAYFAQELLTTFQDDLQSVTLVPSRPPSPGGIFLVTVDGAPIWDRKIEGRFPETKELKQRIRDVISPDKNLGHSDVSPPAVEEESGESKQTVKGEKCDECPGAEEGEQEAGKLVHAAPHDIGSLLRPHVSISYCVGCKWLYRAAWYAQELLTTFQDDINSVSLVPSRPPAPGGKFTVSLNDIAIWDRETEGRHAEAKELKQRIRDKIVPDRNLGHSDVVHEKKEDVKDQPVDIENMDESEAAELRNFYGVM